MDSNTHSTGGPDGLGALVAELQELAAQAVRGLPDAGWAERILTLWGLADRLEGQWLAELAAIDARGAAGADQASRPAPPPPGSGPASAWDPAPPPAWCGPPELSFVAPWPEPPRP